MDTLHERKLRAIVVAARLFACGGQAVSPATHTGHDGAGKIQLAREQAAAPAEETLPFLQAGPATETCLRPDEPAAGLAVLSHIRCLHGKHSEHALSSSFQTASGSIAYTAGRQPLPAPEKKVQQALSRTTCHPDEQTQEEAP